LPINLFFNLPSLAECSIFVSITPGSWAHPHGIRPLWRPQVRKRNEEEGIHGRKGNGRHTFSYNQIITPKRVILSQMNEHVFRIVTQLVELFLPCC
jgi:hypothetical protein